MLGLVHSRLSPGKLQVGLAGFFPKKVVGVHESRDARMISVVLQFVFVVEQVSHLPCTYNMPPADSERISSVEQTFSDNAEMLAGL
jgi:hypothetical protein